MKIQKSVIVVSLISLAFFAGCEMEKEAYENGFSQQVAGTSITTE